MLNIIAGLLTLFATNDDSIIKAKYGEQVVLSIPSEKDDGFYINVSYEECKPGDRGGQYFFLSFTVDMEKYLSTPNSNIIMGGYYYSKLQYVKQEFKDGNTLLYFNVNKDAILKWKKACEIAEIPWVPFSNNIRVFMRQYGSGQGKIIQRNIRIGV
jgi:hypothetical protein